MTNSPVIIMCGGNGTRLGVLTKDTPKALVEVCGKPFLFWLLKDLQRQGFGYFIISTGYKHEKFDEAIYNGAFSGLGIDITLIHDDRQIGTKSEIARIFYDLDLERAIVINGDTYPLFNIAIQTGGIYHDNDIDTGVHLYTKSNFNRFKHRHFIDIGTPEGLERFTKYCEVSLANNKDTTKN